MLFSTLCKTRPSKRRKGSDCKPNWTVSFGIRPMLCLFSMAVMRLSKYSNERTSRNPRVQSMNVMPPPKSLSQPRIPPSNHPRAIIHTYPTHDPQTFCTLPNQAFQARRHRPAHRRSSACHDDDVDRPRFSFNRLPSSIRVEAKRAKKQTTGT